MKTALIAGASGLVGGELIELLIESGVYEKIIVVGRGELNVKHPKIVSHIVNFDELELHKDFLAANDYFCCLGTTIKKAKTKEAFKKVDFVYPIQLAQIALYHNARSFSLVSALGADKNALFFYSKVKGETEEHIKNLGLKSCHIFQPSLLLGNRKEFRFGEYVATLLFKALSWAFVGNMKKYKANTANKVAKAMFNLAQNSTKRVLYVDSEMINSF